MNKKDRCEVSSIRCNGGKQGEDVVRGECEVDECIVRMRERVQAYLRAGHGKEGGQ